MAFEIVHKYNNGLNITEIQNTDTQAKIQILPESGVRWHGWIISQNGQEKNLIDHYENEADLQENAVISHKSSKLSPFACRIPEGEYTFNNTSYQFSNLDKDGNAIHGLLFTKTFQLQERKQEADKASVRFLHKYRGEDPGYPFDYDCIVTYTLHGDNRVTLETRVKNLSSEAIPFVDGWHPYFTTGSKVNACNMQFNSKEVIEFNEKLIPTGHFHAYHEFATERPIGDIELDHSFLLDEKRQQPQCTFYDPAEDIRINIYPSEAYPILQIYIPPHRKSIAIENLSGAPDAFNNGIDLLQIAPGEEKVFSVTYEALL